MNLEEYLESMDDLPVEVRRNFKLMKELDNRAHDIMKIIDGQSKDYMKEIVTRREFLTEEMKQGKILAINKLFCKAREYSEDKVALAIQTYELVDKHIRRLDYDLEKFEVELQDKYGDIKKEVDVAKSPPKQRGRKKKVSEGAKEKRKRTNSSDREAIKTNGSKKKQKAEKNKEKLNCLLNRIGVNPSGFIKSETETDEGDEDGLGDGLDMPVDPNEPTYCLCHQVSYGEMIGCDNMDCPIEWFHFACVGLTTKPKGKWYCPKCNQDRKKK